MKGRDLLILVVLSVGAVTGGIASNIFASQSGRPGVPAPVPTPQAAKPLSG